MSMFLCISSHVSPSKNKVCCQGMPDHRFSDFRCLDIFTAARVSLPGSRKSIKPDQTRRRGLRPGRGGGGGVRWRCGLCRDEQINEKEGDTREREQRKFQKEGGRGGRWAGHRASDTKPQDWTWG